MAVRTPNYLLLLVVVLAVVDSVVVCLHLVVNPLKREVSVRAAVEAAILVKEGEAIWPLAKPVAKLLHVDSCFLELSECAPSLRGVGRRLELSVEKVAKANLVVRVQHHSSEFLLRHSQLVPDVDGVAVVAARVEHVAKEDWAKLFLSSVLDGL